MIDPQSSEGLCPFLKGLGMPGFICPAVGVLERSTELNITCVPAGAAADASGAEGEGERSRSSVERLRVEDKTALSSRNVTETTLDGEETEKATKTGRKRFMLSGTVETAPDTGAATSVVTCRLFQRGDGWYTRQERSLVPPLPPKKNDEDTDGVDTKRKNKKNEKDSLRLRERNVLVSPGKEDVIVDRYFTRVQ